jgi:hypothetical protein
MSDYKKETIEEFLKRGGKITKLAAGYPINLGSLDKSKKPQWTREDIKEGKGGSSKMPNYNTYKKGSYHDFDVGGDKIPVFEPSKKNKND